MPHVEPTGDRMAGDPTAEPRLPTPYEAFMFAQEIPIVRGIGIRDLRDVALAPWKRTGGKGAFIQLDGMGTWSAYVVEVPPGGALAPERHIYEELFYVLEGHGTTEVWTERRPKQLFEWQAGSLFSVPLNASHRLVNATFSPALILVATTAPAIIDRFADERFVFDNAYEFPGRYDGEEGYFRPSETLETLPNGRAMLRTAIIPDIATCYLPLDNTRAPGYRWVGPRMANNRDFLAFVAEYPVGRYSKAHAHPSGPVLICVRGRGYTYTWPAELGIRPWEAGKADQVKYQEYVAGGMVSAAPGGSEWFHQHFGVAKDSFRMLAISAGKIWAGEPGTTITVHTADLQEGGRSIRYADEDPYIRSAYAEALRSSGAQVTMPESVYRPRPAERIPAT